MKVLFLDIDGVLNSAKTFQAAENRLFGRYFLDAVMIRRLDRVIEETGAKVVISSCWRAGDGGQRVARILAGAGLRHADAVVGETARLDGVRGAEIADWMKNRWDVEAFAIVDDDNDMGDLMPHLVRTSWLEGLQDEHVERLIAMLGRGDSETAERLAADVCHLGAVARRARVVASRQISCQDDRRGPLAISTESGSTGAQDSPSGRPDIKG